MKCDNEPMGCAICQLYKKECKVTDMTTGHTMTRGAILRLKEELKHAKKQIVSMGNRIYDLQNEIKGYKRRLYEFQCPQNAQVCQQFPLPLPLDMNSGREKQTPSSAFLQGYNCNNPPLSFYYPSTTTGVCPDEFQALPHNYEPSLFDLPRTNPLPQPLPAAPVSPLSLSPRFPDYQQELTEFERLWAMRTPAPGLVCETVDPRLIFPDSNRA